MFPLFGALDALPESSLALVSLLVSLVSFSSSLDLSFAATKVLLLFVQTVFPELASFSASSLVTTESFEIMLVFLLVASVIMYRSS